MRGAVDSVIRVDNICGTAHDLQRDASIDRHVTERSRGGTRIESTAVCEIESDGDVRDAPRRYDRLGIRGPIAMICETIQNDCVDILEGRPVRIATGQSAPGQWTTAPRICSDMDIDVYISQHITRDRSMHTKELIIAIGIELKKP